jgi:electron transfer flavoprotein alpha subunit
MAVLLIAEVVNGELSLDATAKALTAAKPLGDVTVLPTVMIWPNQWLI